MAEIATAPGRTGGLSSAIAAARLSEVGPNEITRAGATPLWVLLRAQFANPLILLLIAACAIAAIPGELADAIAIGVIVVLNAPVGIFQEYPAERAILALRSLSAPGDTLLLEAGDIVAQSFASRSRTRTLWQLGPFTNGRLLIVVALSFGAGLIVVTVLEASKLFRQPRPRMHR